MIRGWNHQSSLLKKRTSREVRKFSPTIFVLESETINLVSSDIGWSNRRAWYIRRGQGTDFTKSNSLLDLFERVLSGRCIEHNLVVPPKYLHQPPNKGCQLVLAFWGPYQRSQLVLNDYPSCHVKRDMTQVAFGLLCTRPSTLIALDFLFPGLFVGFHRCRSTEEAMTLCCNSWS